MNQFPANGRQDRRAFLKQAAGFGGLLATGGTFLSACSSAGQAAGGSTLRAAVGVNHPLGVQLYTVRDQLRTDFPGTLERVAEIGYTEFEFAGYGNLTPTQVRALLDRLGVTAPSSHLGLNLFRDNLDKTIGDSGVIGHRYLVVPSANGRTVEGWTELAADFNRYGEAVRRAGMRFGYHNHAGEFADLGGGTTAYDILLRNTDPALVDMELDIYWAVRGGQDPVAMFGQSPGRYKLFHVKDMSDRAGAQTMAPVGEGEIDFRSIFENARLAGVEHFFVEHDNAAEGPGGSLASIATSYRNLRSLLP
jgi:sugar phosphate isomerase/epimerase